MYDIKGQFSHVNAILCYKYVPYYYINHSDVSDLRTTFCVPTKYIVEGYLILFSNDNIY